METFLNVMSSFNEVKFVLFCSVNGTFQEAASHMGIVSLIQSLLYLCF